jgi:hypothetical protein
MAPEPISTAYFVNPSHRFVCMCIPQSLPCNSSVKSYRGNDYTRNNRRTVGRVVFCAVCVASKESRPLVLPRTYCLYREMLLWDVVKVWFQLHMIWGLFLTYTKIKLVHYITDTIPNSNDILSVILELKLANRNDIFIMRSYHAHRINNTKQYIFIRWRHTCSCTRCHFFFRFQFLDWRNSVLFAFWFVQKLHDSRRWMWRVEGSDLYVDL